MPMSVRSKIDSTAFSRGQFCTRLDWWTARALEIDQPVRWVERIDGRVGRRLRLRWELLAELDGRATCIATAVAEVPRLRLRPCRITMHSMIPGFAELMGEALQTHRSHERRILSKRCVVLWSSPKVEADRPILEIAPDPVFEA